MDGDAPVPVVAGRMRDPGLLVVLDAAQPPPAAACIAK